MTVKLTQHNAPSNYGISPTEFGSRVIIMVEGGSDQAVLARVIGRFGLSGFQVHNMQGRDDWGPRLAALAEDDGFRANCEAVGLVMDAETDPDAAWDKCVGALNAGGFPIPVNKGSLADGGAIRTGIFIIPEYAVTGAVENLLLPAGDPQRVQAAQEYLDGLQAHGMAIPPPNRIPKAQLLSYVAARPQLLTSVAVAVKDADAFDWNHVAFDALKVFVGELHGV